MDIREMQIAFKQEASRLGDYQLMSKTELANGYCDQQEEAWRAKEAGDEIAYSYAEDMRSAYHSALMLRYWYKIFEWAQNSSSLHLPLEDFVDWLIDSLWVAFYYKTWRWEYEAVCKDGRFIEYKKDENGELIPNKYYWRVDPNAPDKMINRCCGSMRGRWYQYYNKDKRKASVQTYSLDAMVDENGDSALDYTGCVDENTPTTDSCKYLVTMLLDRGEGIEALIIDGIANYDTFREKKYEQKYMQWNAETAQEEEKTRVSTTNQFDARKLVKHLNSIDEDFITSFCYTYSINEVKGLEIYNKLKNLTNTKLYKLIEKTKIEIKNNPDMLSCIYA